eukprot:TRINITY_DN100_c0_g2_i15.p1 TRINITY_DN100_c0_g2~~TRINITY_DN100_c0_g2_i15.p1  ORF type:complete len:995 (-),score=300.19 TRINITY_DN100_c0_g2_i15:1551-4535(-)
MYKIALAGAMHKGADATIKVSARHISTKDADFNAPLVSGVAQYIKTAVTQYGGSGELTTTDDANGGVIITWKSGADGMTFSDLEFSVPIANDDFAEGEENYSPFLTEPNSNTGSRVTLGNDAVVTIIDDTQGAGGALDQVQWSISGAATVDEGKEASYTISLAGQFGASIGALINVAFTHIDTTSADFGTGKETIDAILVASLGAAVPVQNIGTLKISDTTISWTATEDGQSFPGLSFLIPTWTDGYAEGPEDYQPSIENPKGSGISDDAVTLGVDKVTTKIIDADATVQWNIGGVSSVDEGAHAVYTVTLTGTFAKNIDATIGLYSKHIDTRDEDYEAMNTAVQTAVTAYSGSGGVGTLSTTDGTTITWTSTEDGQKFPGLTIKIPIVNDDFAEGPENYEPTLKDPVSKSNIEVTLGVEKVTTTINDVVEPNDDPIANPSNPSSPKDAVKWSVKGATSVDEGAKATYQLQIEGALGIEKNAVIKISRVDIDTNDADFTESFPDVVTKAVNAYTSPGKLTTTDGNTITWTATGDGDKFPGINIEVPITNDDNAEGPEDYQPTLSDPTSTTSTEVTLGDDKVVTKIYDTVQPRQVENPSEPDPSTTPIDSVEWSISGQSTVDEGGEATYVINLKGPLGKDNTAVIEVDYTPKDTNDVDFKESFPDVVTKAVTAYTGPGKLTTPDGKTITFEADVDGANFPGLSFQVPITEDNFVEGTEDFEPFLKNPGSTTEIPVTLGDDRVTTTIQDTGANKAEFSITGDVTVDEGGTAKYEITLTEKLGKGENVKVEIELVPVDTDDEDYVSFIEPIKKVVDGYTGPGTLDFDDETRTLTWTTTEDGQTFPVFPIEVSITDDEIAEGPEKFQPTLKNPDSTTGVGVTLGNDRVTTTINDTQGVGGDYDKVDWNISPSPDDDSPSVNEGKEVCYEITLSGLIPKGKDAVVDIACVHVDTNDADYASCVDAVKKAVDSYSGTGTLTVDGNSVSWVSGDAKENFQD